MALLKSTICSLLAYSRGDSIPSIDKVSIKLFPDRYNWGLSNRIKNNNGFYPLVIYAKNKALRRDVSSIIYTSSIRDSNDILNSVLDHISANRAFAHILFSSPIEFARKYKYKGVKYKATFGSIFDDYMNPLLLMTLKIRPTYMQCTIFIHPKLVEDDTNPFSKLIKRNLIPFCLKNNININISTDIDGFMCKAPDKNRIGYRQYIAQLAPNIVSEVLSDYSLPRQYYR